MKYINGFRINQDIPLRASISYFYNKCKARISKSSVYFVVSRSQTGCLLVDFFIANNNNWQSEDFNGKIKIGEKYNLFVFTCYKGGVELCN